MRNLRSYAILFLGGAIVGTAYDYIHVYYGVLSYASPDFAGTSLRFVPLEFGLSALAGAAVVQWLGRRLEAPRVSAPRLAFDASLLLAGYLATGLLVGEDLAIALVLAALAGLTVGTRLSRFTLLAAALAGVSGPVGEICVSGAGVFHYNSQPHIIPLWLPLLWIVASGLFLDLPVLLLLRRS